MKDTFETNTLHPAAKMYAEEVRAGQLSRREFLVRSTALGVSAVAAYGLLGLDAPAQAQDAAVGSPGTITGRIFTEDVREPDRNFFYAQTTSPNLPEPRTSTMEVIGKDPIAWI